MKRVRSAILAVLALSVFVVPAYANHIEEGPQRIWFDVFSQDPYEAEAAAAGESSVGLAVKDSGASSVFADVFGLDPYDAEAASAGESAVGLARMDSAAGSVFADVFGRDPYEAEAARATFNASSDASALIADDVFGRDPYEVLRYDDCSVC